MSLFDNNEDQRFEFTLTITPKSVGDYGAFSIGGRQRSPEECFSLASEMEEQIKRHVDCVDSIEVTVNDVYQEYEDLSDWYYNQQKRKFSKENNVNLWKVSFEDIKDKFPKHTYDKGMLLYNYNWVRNSLIKGDFTPEEIVEQMDADVPREYK